MDLATDFKEMAKQVVPRTARARNAHIRRRNANERKALKEPANRFFFTPHAAVDVFDAHLQRFFYQVPDVFAQRFSRDEMCNAPIGQSGVFSQHVADARADKPQRSIAKARPGLPR